MTMPKALDNVVAAAGLSDPPRFLTGLTTAQRKLVVQSAERRSYRAHSVIMRGGDLAGNLFLLQKGGFVYHGVINQGIKVLLCWVTPEDFFGTGGRWENPKFYLVTRELFKTVNCWCGAAREFERWRKP